MIRELYQSLKEKKISSVELTTKYLEKIDQLNPKINAFLHVSDEDALSTAKKADSLLGKEDMCWLTGIPGSIKDSILTQGVPTTAGSKILEGFVPPYDATVSARLKSVFSPILGKTNLDEFSFGSSNENSAYGDVSNPYDMGRVPGGSSGGSAAAVAAGLSVWALGGDTGGSIREPASFSGVVGLKPTYGRVSRYGLIAFGSSLDCIGPITRSVEDSALVLNIIAGYDPHDSTSSKKELPDYSKDLGRDVKGLKVGLPKEYFIPGLDKEVEASVRAAAKKLEELGAHVVEVSLPHTDEALSVYYVVATSEASSNLSRYDGVRYGKTRENFGSEVKRRIALGTYSLSSGYYDAYYLKASRVRTLIKKDFDEAFKNVDVLLTPVAPTPAFKKNSKSSPLEMYLADIFTIPASLAGVPALSLPVGTSNNLPVGAQIIGPHFGEEIVLRVGHQLEKSLNMKMEPSL